MGRDVESGKKKNGEQRCELKAHINSRKKIVLIDLNIGTVLNLSL